MPRAVPYVPWQGEKKHDLHNEPMVSACCGAYDHKVQHEMTALLLAPVLGRSCADLRLSKPRIRMHVWKTKAYIWGSLPHAAAELDLEEAHDVRILCERKLFTESFMFDEGRAGDFLSDAAEAAEIPIDDESLNLEELLEAFMDDEEKARPRRYLNSYVGAEFASCTPV